MSTTTLKNGNEVSLHNGMLAIRTSGGTALSVPVTPDELAAVGRALLECAVAAAQDESEKAGAELGLDLVQELYELRGRPQAEAFKALRHALLALVKLDYPESACGGFAGAVANVLEIGMAHLTKGEPE